MQASQLSAATVATDEEACLSRTAQRVNEAGPCRRVMILEFLNTSGVQREAWWAGVGVPAGAAAGVAGDVRQRREGGRLAGGGGLRRAHRLWAALLWRHAQPEGAALARLPPGAHSAD